MSYEIKPHKVLSPSEMLETLGEIKDVQAEIICHLQAWLHDPRPEVDERYIAARQREAKMLEDAMVFDRRLWRKNATDEATIKSEAKREQRLRRRAEQAVQRRYHDDQPEGEGL